MESKMTQFARQALLAASQGLNSEEQVNAFLAHSRMMVAVYRAGQRLPPLGISSLAARSRFRSPRGS